MSEERLRILKMVEDKKITAEEAAKLLSAMDSPASQGKAHWLKVRVFDKDSEKPKVRVTVPLSILRIAGKLGGKFQVMMPEEARAQMEAKGIKLDAESLENIEQLFDELAVNGRYQLVNVEDDEGGQRVEVYID